MDSSAATADERDRATPYGTVERRRPLSAAELLVQAEDLFGEQLAWVIAAGAWPNGSPGTSSRPPLDLNVESRLRVALHVAALLLEAEAPETVRAWFVGKNPMLNDRAPAIVVAEDPSKVFGAARDFATYG